MNYILLIFAFFIILFVTYKYITTLPTSELRGYLVKLTLVVASIILVLLAITGRIHWVGAALAGILTTLRFMIPLLIKSLPFLSQLFIKRNFKKNNDTQMKKKEALKILGLSGRPTKNEIINAHKKLIQKIHPDRGGSEYLATTINLAKETLLEK